MGAFPFTHHYSVETSYETYHHTYLIRNSSSRMFFSNANAFHAFTWRSFESVS